MHPKVLHGSPSSTPFAWLRRLWGRTGPMLFFRNVGALGIAAVACLVPEVGPNRFWLAAILVFGCIPAATWLELRYPVAENGWSEPLFDLGVLLTLVHLAPSMWFPALVIGLIVVQAPSVAESRTSFLFYGLFAVLLTAGMTFAAVVHDVPNWGLPILCMALLYPSVIFYSHRQATRANEIRKRARALEGLQLVSGGVAHDFNNLLAGVLGHAELAQLELAEDHPAREAIDEVVSGTNRAGLLSARLLAFSGRNPAVEELLELEAEIRDLVALMQPVVRKGIELRLESRAAGLRVRADRTQLQQVVMNLILNASEATEKLPGCVWITLRPVDDPSRTGTWVELRVRDRGIGIPPGLEAKIFDPFFTSKERGHGLGLASARTIVRELGGQIELETSEGEGTEFRVRLPAERASKALPEAAARAASEPAPGGLALVVDDERSVRSLLARLLLRLGYGVVEAEDADQALEQFRRRPDEIRLIVLDLRMPGKDGWQCLRELRAIRRDVPVVVCSGHDPKPLERDRLGPGVAFLAKPFRIDRLREILAGLSRESARGRATARQLPTHRTHTGP